MSISSRIGRVAAYKCADEKASRAADVTKPQSHHLATSRPEARGVTASCSVWVTVSGFLAVSVAFV